MHSQERCQGDQQHIVPISRRLTKRLGLADNAFKVASIARGPVVAHGTWLSAQALGRYLEMMDQYGVPSI